MNAQPDLLDYPLVRVVLAKRFRQHGLVHIAMALEAGDLSILTDGEYMQVRVLLDQLYEEA